MKNDSSPISNASLCRCSFHQPMTAVQSAMSHLAGSRVVSWRHTGNELMVVGRQQLLESFVNLLQSSLFIVHRPVPITLTAQHRHLTLVDVVVTRLLRYTQQICNVTLTLQGAPQKKRPRFDSCHLLKCQNQFVRLLLSKINLRVYSFTSLFFNHFLLQ